MTATRKKATGQLLVGLLVMGVGILWTLDRLGLADAGEFWRYWPVLLIGHGISQLMSPPDAKGRRHGMFAVLAGLWFLGNTTDVLHWDTSWPLLIIAVGLSIVWKALSEQGGRDTATAENDHER